MSGVLRWPCFSVCLSACLSVCLSASISPEPHFPFSPYFCAYYLFPWLGPPLAALQYAIYFQFLRMLSCLCIMPRNRRRNRDSVDNSMDLLPWRILKLTHQGQHRTGYLLLISTIALFWCRDYQKDSYFVFNMASESAQGKEYFPGDDTMAIENFPLLLAIPTKRYIYSSVYLFIDLSGVACRFIRIWTCVISLKQTRRRRSVTGATSACRIASTSSLFDLSIVSVSEYCVSVCLSVSWEIGVYTTKDSVLCSQILHFLYLSKSVIIF